jgi:hypothetical protein
MNQGSKMTTAGMMAVLHPTNAADKISSNSSFGSRRMLQDETHMSTEVAHAMDVGWFPYEAFDTDARIAQTTIFAKAANHKDYIPRPISSIRSGFRRRHSVPDISNQCGIQGIQIL